MIDVVIHQYFEYTSATSDLSSVFGCGESVRCGTALSTATELERMMMTTHPQPKRDECGVAEAALLKGVGVAVIVAKAVVEVVEVEMVEVGVVKVSVAKEVKVGVVEVSVDKEVKVSMVEVSVDKEVKVGAVEVSVDKEVKVGMVEVSVDKEVKVGVVEVSVDKEVKVGVVEVSVDRGQGGRGRATSSRVQDQSLLGMSSCVSPF